MWPLVCIIQKPAYISWALMVRLSAAFSLWPHSSLELKISSDPPTTRFMDGTVNRRSAPPPVIIAFASGT